MADSGPLSNSTFTNAGGAVSDIFSSIGDSYKKQGDLIEQGMYQDEASLATQNAAYTAQSTAIKEAQESRSIYKSQSGTEADVAGAGLAKSGSALDILADSASQGALTKQVMQQQGLMTEAGYQEQAKSYTAQADAAGVAAQGAGIAGIGADVGAVIKGAAAIAPFLLL